MNRQAEIEKLERRYAAAIGAHKRKTANLIYARLCSLKTRQLKSELRASRSLPRRDDAGRGQCLPHTTPATYSDDIENCTQVYGE